MDVIRCDIGSNPQKSLQDAGRADIMPEEAFAPKLMPREGVEPGETAVAEAKTTIRADQKMACAGTGRPKKDFVWRVSILNFANRSAEKTGIANAESRSNLYIQNSFHDKLYNRLSIKLNSIIPGATPKLTTSANESSSFPMGENAFKSRAAKPSKKSKTAAMKIATIAP